MSKALNNWDLLKVAIVIKIKIFSRDSIGYSLNFVNKMIMRLHTRSIFFDVGDSTYLYRFWTIVYREQKKTPLKFKTYKCGTLMRKSNQIWSKFIDISHRYQCNMFGWCIRLCNEFKEIICVTHGKGREKRRANRNKKRKFVRWNKWSISILNLIWAIHIFRNLKIRLRNVCDTQTS